MTLGSIRPRTWTAIAFVVVTLVTSSFAVRRSIAAGGDQRSGRTNGDLAAAEAAATRMTEVEQRSRAIEFYERRLRDDRENTLDLAQLGGLYLQRARETGNHEDLHHAEGFARRSLAATTTRNGKSFVTLANALLGQHRFVEAAAVARDLVELDPITPSYRALLAEIQMELGDGLARTTFESLRDVADQLPVAPRMARWLEVQGQPQAALRLLERAREEAVRRQGELPREQVAWFHLRSGDCLARMGRLNDADRMYRAGLAFEPADHRLWLARARVAATRGRWNESLAAAQHAATLVPDFAALLTTHAAYVALGDTVRAAATDRVLARRAADEHTRFNRAWTLYLLDQGRDVPRALALAEQELAVRQDIYGWDVFAWALFKSSRFEAARNAMAHALATGAHDPSIFRHASAIEAALGNAIAARAWAACAA